MRTEDPVVSGDSLSPTAHPECPHLSKRHHHSPKFPPQRSASLLTRPVCHTHVHSISKSWRFYSKNAPAPAPVSPLLPPWPRPQPDGLQPSPLVPLVRPLQLSPFFSVWPQE